MDIINRLRYFVILSKKCGYLKMSCIYAFVFCFYFFIFLFGNLQGDWITDHRTNQCGIEPKQNEKRLYTQKRVPPAQAAKEVPSRQWAKSKFYFKLKKINGF